MGLIRWLVAWWSVTERPAPPKFRAPQDHFDKAGRYTFKDAALGRAAEIARELGATMSASVGFVQSSSTGATAISSGSTGTLTTAPTAGNSFLVYVMNIGATTGTSEITTSVSGQGTYVYLGSVIANTGGTNLEVEAWFCMSVTTSTTNLTTTNSQGVAWTALGYEFTNVQAVSAGLGGSGGSGVQATVSAGCAIVSATVSQSGYSAVPSSPWTDFGGSPYYGVFDAAYQLVSTASTPAAASWTSAGGNFLTLTVFLFPNVSPITLICQSASANGAPGSAGIGTGSPMGYFKIPTGVTSVNAQAWGGGGGGGSGASGHGGAGGGGGEYAQEPALAVTPGNLLQWNVGVGASAASTPVAATASTVAGASVTVTANPASTGTPGGTGSTNTVHFNGGAGAVASASGGGGGGSGGTTSAGNAGSGTSGGSAVTGGGPGGAAASIPASGPGGGGGGATQGTGHQGAGGVYGGVQLTWTAPASSVVTKPQAVNQTALVRAANW